MTLMFMGHIFLLFGSGTVYLTSGQMVGGQVNADFLSCLHLETVHGLTSLGDIDLVVVRVAHYRSLLCFLRKKVLSEESIFVPYSQFAQREKVYEWMFAAGMESKTYLFELKKQQNSPLCNCTGGHMG